MLDHIGEAYLKLGKTAEALSAWQKSLAIEDNKKVADKIEAAKQKLTKGGCELMTRGVPVKADEIEALMAG